MFRLFILLSAIPIIVTFAVRWWFGNRVISAKGRHQCSCDLEKWNHAFGSESLPPSRSGDAIIFATALRKSALADWRTRAPKAAASREGTRRFGMAVPPLAAMCAILGLIVGRIPAAGVIAIFLGAIAFAAIIAYLGIAPELKAIITSSRRLRETRVFARRDDEDAVIEAANALAWREAAPPIFNLLQK